VLQRFAACLEQVKTFMESKGLTYPEMEQPDWQEKLHFMVDITGHLNMLNRSIQGKGSTAIQMLEYVSALERKITLFVRCTERLLPLPERVQRSTQQHQL